MVNILFISYEFPPLKKGGVFRPLGFCESLVSSKYNPVVITVSKDCWQREGQNLDFGLGVETRKKLDIIEIQKNSNLLSSKSSIQQKITLFFSVCLEVVIILSANLRAFDSFRLTHV